MKLMKRTFRALAILTLFAASFSSCKKDDKPASTADAGSLTVDSKTYATNIGAFVKYNNSDYGQLVITTDSNVFKSPYTGKVSLVDIGLDLGSITEGTFTYKSSDDEAFDAKKNFYFASVGADVTVTNSSPSGGTMLEDVTDGTLTVAKSATGYTITYTLKFGDQTVTGKYVGSVTPVIMTQPD